MRHEIRLAVGPACFRIGSDWRRPIDQLRALYRDYPDAAGRVPDFAVRLEATNPWRRHLRPQVAIRGDHELPDAVPVALRHGLLAAEMGMNLQMALGWRRHLLLHAGVAERNGRALILTGTSGAGKSTLAMLLGEAGWRFLGDEFGLLDLATGALAPFPRPISLKNEAVAFADALAGRLGPVMAGTAKGTIRHVAPRLDALARMAEPAAPALILFPRWGEAAARRPVGPAEAFMRLTQASTNYVALGRAAFDALTGLVANVPAHAIDYRSAEEAFALIEELWA